MSLPTITHVKLFTKSLFVVFTTTTCFFSAQGDWKIDLSRRLNKKRQMDIKDNTLEHLTKKVPFDWLANKQGTEGAIKELVLLHTEKGFTPKTIHLREGTVYKIHVVNINEKQKNVSFVLDSFSEYHATYFGKTKAFIVNPKREGVFSFNCPETSAQGKLVVYPPPTKAPRRHMASEE